MSASHPAQPAHSLRSLPPQPSLEFERKEAKALLRRLRAGDPEALARARARHPAIDTLAPERIQLADTQLVIAREYGFTSWPKLVRYFRDVERQQHAHKSIHNREHYDVMVRALLVEHRQQRTWAGLTVAAYVPRFYGMRPPDVFASELTEDEARLALARQYNFPSWQALLDGTAAELRKRPREWEIDPMRRVFELMQRGDVDALKLLVEKHPELLQPSGQSARNGYDLVSTALLTEERVGVEAVRPVLEWLTSLGLDLQDQLNRRLCGHLRMETQTVRRLLDRGADPNWVAPNGIPVLEHALIRYWNGEAVDLVASRVRPRQALWIAAGLGDVQGVGRFLDAQGTPTPEARKHRPDFAAVGPGGIPSHPDPEDEWILMEAFFVAMLNGRAAVLEYMVSRGFNVDTLIWGSPIIGIAVGNRMTAMVEALVRCGADLDLRGWRPNRSARELARDQFEQDPESSDHRRILELCGMDPDTILAERDARPVNPPRVHPSLQDALDLAGDDAFRLAQSEIRIENLVFGLLRKGSNPRYLFTQVSGMDVERFHADHRERLLPADDRLERPKLPLDAEARTAVQTAVGMVTARRRDTVNGHHLLYILARPDDGAVATLLSQYGGNVARMRTELERAIT